MTNFILGCITGIVLPLLLGYIIFRLDENDRRKQMGEEYEYILMTKSEFEKYEKYRKENEL